MLHRIETTDPITLRDIPDLTGKPYLIERSESEDLVIYFESEANRREYMNIPVEHPIEHRLNLDNPCEQFVEEG